jgi:hypothetical protein
MSQYGDTGQVKARLSELFKADIGFMKSANLAGEMVTRHWDHSWGDNYDQRALCILVSSAKSLLIHNPNSAENSVYLWCHQKATSKRSSWFFSIGTTAADVSTAYNWLTQKATSLAEQTGETIFLNCYRQSDNGPTRNH